MANTINQNDNVIEVSDIDSDFTMEAPQDVMSVVFKPGAVGDYVEIRDVRRGMTVANSPMKTIFSSGDGEPRVQYFYNSLQLGFDFSDAVLSAGTKIAINLGG